MKHFTPHQAAPSAGHIASVNSVVVSVLFIAGITPTNYSILSEIQKVDDAHERVPIPVIARPIYVNKQSDCLLSRAHGFIGL